MADTPIEFTDFRDDHLDEAVALSQAEAWPHRREDWDLVLSISRGAVALRQGRVVGTALTTPFGPVAAINMVIVAASARGRGIGRALMEQAIDKAGGRTLRLTATEDGLPLYRKLGFVPTGRIVQHQGAPSAAPAPRSAVAWAHCEDGPAILALDRAATGMDRTPLFDRLASQARIAVTRGADGRPDGFAALRTFGRGEVIGPIVARQAEGALDLLHFAAAHRRSEFLRVDTPLADAFSAPLEALGLLPVGGGVAMERPAATACLREAAPSPTDPVTFALASQALG